MTATPTSSGAPPLVLASGSRFRAAMLRNAGLAFDIDPARVDEAAIRDSLAAEGASVHAVAEALAETKALQVSHRRPEALVLGADQMLEVDGAWLEKPAGRAQARRHLERLSGRPHRLVTAAVVAEGGARIWHVVDVADLAMRPLSEAYVDWYLDRMGDAVTESVGAYQLEGLGAQLFASVRGDYFTVLGLPLLPVLGFLRQRGVIPA